MAHGKSVIYDKKIFGSVYEVARYLTLKDMQSSGEIYQLECHPRYLLVPAIKGFTVIKQIYKRGDSLPDLYAEFDFSYVQNGKKIVEDVKADGVFYPLYKKGEKAGKVNTAKRGWLLEEAFLIKLKMFLWMKEPEEWDFLIPEITKEELDRAKQAIRNQDKEIGSNRSKIKKTKK